MRQVSTREKSIVQRFEGNAALLQLTLGPFIAIQAYLDGVGSVGAYFDEGWTEILVMEVEVALPP